MVDKKTHDETTITPLDGTEELYIVSTGGTVTGTLTDASSSPSN